MGQHRGHPQAAPRPASGARRRGPRPDALRAGRPTRSPRARAAYAPRPRSRRRPPPRRPRTAVQYLLATVEAYPDLKSHGNVLALQKEIDRLESMLSDRRELYNDQVYRYNTRIRTWPTLPLAWASAGAHARSSGPSPRTRRDPTSSSPDDRGRRRARAADRRRPSRADRVGPPRAAHGPDRHPARRRRPGPGRGDWASPRGPPLRARAVQPAVARARDRRAGRASATSWRSTTTSRSGTTASSRA